MAKSVNPDTSTEEKIKEAARKVFIQKGFAATRTRDIADEAGINLALLNYYFRSKQRLFEIIMTETLEAFMKRIVTVLNDEKSSLEDKIGEIASKYIDMLIEVPEIPTFVLSEIRSHPEKFIHKLPIKEVLDKSIFYKQYAKAIKEGKVQELNPIHFMMNMFALIVFPFIAKPMIEQNIGLGKAEFEKLMLERKKMVPVWIKSIIGIR